MRHAITSLLATSFLVAACGSEPAPDVEESAVEEIEVDAAADDRTEMLTALMARLGRVQWKVVSVDETLGLPTSTEVTVVFNGDEFAGRGPCNRFFGALNRDPNVPGLFGPVGSTRMMCDETSMRLEDAFFKALGSVQDARFEDDKLILEWSSAEDGDSGELVLVPDVG